MKQKWSKLAAITVIIFIAAFNSGCSKNKIDITGVWRVDFILGTAGYFEVGFAGNSTSGYVVWNNQTAGEYSVSGKDLEFVLRITFEANGDMKMYIYHFVGAFETDNRMSGTVKAYDLNVQNSEVNGTWFAQRT